MSWIARHLAGQSSAPVLWIVMWMKGEERKRGDVRPSFVSFFIFCGFPSSDTRRNAFLNEFPVDDLGVFMPFVCANPHLLLVSRAALTLHAKRLTFLKVLNPARIPPPIHVVYFRSAGAEIRIFMSSTANLLISRINRSGKFLQSVEPPERTMLRYSDFRRSRSVRVMASWTIWWTPGYSRPMSSGSKRISGAR